MMADDDVAPYQRQGEEPRLCEHCHQQIRSRITVQGLTVWDDPSEVFWEGIKIPGIPPIRIKLIRSLLRFGRLSYLPLLSLLGEETQIGALKVHMHYIKRSLNEWCGGKVSVITIRGWGYEIKVLP